MKIYSMVYIYGLLDSQCLLSAASNLRTFVVADAIHLNVVIDLFDFLSCRNMDLLFTNLDATTAPELSGKSRLAHSLLKDPIDLFPSFCCVDVGTVRNVLGLYR